jgi:hypothetical protein
LGLGARESRFEPNLPDMPVWAAVLDIEGLEVRAAGAGGGAIDVRFEASVDAGRVETEGVRVIDGVPVLGVEAAEVAAEARICIRTRNMLDGRRVAGLGLEALILALLVPAASPIVLNLFVAAGATLLGLLAGFFATPFRCAGGGGGACCSIISTIDGLLTNIPYPISHSK